MNLVIVVPFRFSVSIIGGSCRVTSVVAFGFLQQNIYEVSGTYEWYFVKNVGRISHNLPYMIGIGFHYRSV